MTRGKFITFEGGEGAGKSTQARLLHDFLLARGIPADLTREPGGTPGAEDVRGLLLDPAQAWNARTEALLFAAARADHVAQLIEPSLGSGRWVICDRFVDSTRAYQGGGGDVLDSEIMDLHRIGSGGLLPDITILVTVDPEIAAERLAARDGDTSDRIGGKPASYHAAVGDRFRELAAQEPSRFVVIDGSGATDEVQARVQKAIAHWLGETG
ncbi:dTMP kinase [Paraurantiacibacter namhicola]|uniref:Thymidylate kinase n=1 Tax=Paraurantiacibacter namhicola TaxID=645517 RepID=A0A1C7D937_9SPHN|nr:dTMP kinase [Paraurantiacibacter namhicola]ANU07968.1 Thymidylate kinase [Paraurantiacibacter namhicola]